VRLPETIVTDTLRKGADFPYETKTSFQRDFERADRQDERDLFGGTILRLGQAFGVDTPVTRRLYETLNQRKPT
jgi:2-dehydropantoate 2-reductase